MPQIPLILQVVDAYGTPAISYPAWEADDVIATIARRAVERGMEVRIVTSDKDCRQLIGPHVQLYNIRKNTYFDAEALKKDWGVRPDQVVDFQALVGDSVDNVPGVPLIGPKKASALIEQFGTLENILANADKAAGGPKLKENLKNFADQARVSRVLVELNANLPIEIDWEAARVNEPDRPRLLSLFTELGFGRFAADMRAQPLIADKRPERNPVRESASDAATLFDEAEEAEEATEEMATGGDGRGEPSVPPAPSTASPDPAPLDPSTRRVYELIDTDEKLERVRDRTRPGQEIHRRPRDDRPRCGERGDCRLGL